MPDKMSDLIPRNDEIPHPVTMEDARPWYCDLSVYEGDKRIGRTTAAQLDRRQRVALYWFHDRATDADMAEKLNVSPATIVKDKQWLLAQWKRIILGDVTELLAFQLAQLDDIMSELWRAWKVSYEDIVTEISRTVTSKDGTITTEETKRTGRLPDPRYMALILQVQEMIIRLLDLERDKDKRMVESFLAAISEAAKISQQRQEAFMAKNPASIDKELEDWR